MAITNSVKIQSSLSGRVAEWQCAEPEDRQMMMSASCPAQEQVHTGQGREQGLVLYSATRRPEDNRSPSAWGPRRRNIGIAVGGERRCTEAFSPAS